MKIHQFFPSLAAALLAAVLFSGAAPAWATPRLDILFMNHGPMQPVIRQIKDALSRRPGLAEAVWHDEETPDGAEFMLRMNITGHIPLMIFLDGSATHEVRGKAITFQGFPSGTGPAMFQGSWSMDDFEALLLAIPGNKP